MTTVSSVHPGLSNQVPAVLAGLPPLPVHQHVPVSPVAHQGGPLPGNNEAPSLGNKNGGDGEQRSVSAPVNAEDGGNGGGGGNNKKKTRRRRGLGGRRRYKPYHKLSTEEKRQLEAREEHRAEKSRATRFAHGQPMAPYNTTQFLLNDREQRTIGAEGDDAAAAMAAEIGMRVRAPSGSDAGNTSETGSGGGGGSSHSDSEFEREFEAEYDNANAERLDTLSRADLIREFLALEHELDSVMNDNRELRREVETLRQKASSVHASSVPMDTQGEVPSLPD